MRAKASPTPEKHIASNGARAAMELYALTQFGVLNKEKERRKYERRF
jgi:hypothetical protein